MATFYALVNIPKTQLKGSAIITTQAVDNPTKGKPTPVAEPPYTSASALTSAIADGTYNSAKHGTANNMYEWIAKWVRYQKSLQTHPLKKASGKGKAIDIGYRCPNFTVR